MLTRFRLAYLRHPLLTIGFALALAVTLFFAARLVVHSVFWADPMHRDQQIEGWMTPGYVAHSWHVPPEIIGFALGLEPATDGRRLTLEELAEDRGLTTAELITALSRAITEYRIAHD